MPNTITKPWQLILALSNSTLTIPNVSITIEIGLLSNALGHLLSSEMLLFFPLIALEALTLLVKNLSVY